MTWVGGPHWVGRGMGLHRICSWDYFKSLGHAGGYRAVDRDLRDGFLGVLVLWLRSSLSFSVVHHNESNRNYSHKSRLAGNNPHGCRGSESASRRYSDICQTLFNLSYNLTLNK